MNIVVTKIPGCFELIPNIFKNQRGTFVKTFQYDFFQNKSLELNFKEEFYSTSQSNVIRGLHFQLPPFEQTKIVSCIRGKILDVILDLRIGSPTYLKHQIIELNSENVSMLYIARGHCTRLFNSLG